MIRLLQFLIDGCFHKWETFDVVNFRRTNDLGGYAEGYRFYQRCERCGTIRKLNVC